MTKVVLTHLHSTTRAGSSSCRRRFRWWSSGANGTPRTIPRPWRVTSSCRATTRVDEQRLVLVDGDHDLLGDGSVELLFTPGHTPGHQSVRAGDLVIGGDVMHYAAGLDDGRFPAFGDDLEAQARSAERLCGLRDAGLTVMPGHDPDVLRPGPLAT